MYLNGPYFGGGDAVEAVVSRFGTKFPYDCVDPIFGHFGLGFLRVHCLPVRENVKTDFTPRPTNAKMRFLVAREG